MAKLLIEDIYEVTPLYPKQYVSHTATQRAQLRRRILRIQAGEPVQYVLGYTFFLGKKFALTQQVLIPRPETEQLTELVQQHLQDAPHNRVLDIGTGSGCIAISLACAGARVDALDISKGALRCARRNARALGAEVRFFERNFLQAPPLAYRYDIVVSNPPYVLEKERAALSLHVRDWEPATALFVPDKEPLLFYKAIAAQAKKLLRPHGQLFFETHAHHGKAVQQWLLQTGYRRVRLCRDLSGRARLVAARAP